MQIRYPVVFVFVIVAGGAVPGVAVALFLVALLRLVVAVAFVGAVAVELLAGAAAVRQLVVVELRRVAVWLEPRRGDHAAKVHQLRGAVDEDAPGELREVAVELDDARAVRERRHDAQLRVKRDANVRCDVVRAEEGCVRLLAVACGVCDGVG